jgi:hypothetical protein
VPKSRTRQKAAYTPPPTRSPKKKISPPWVAPLMLALFVIGVLWLAVFYITGGSVPLIETLGNWNLAVGFGFIVGGFIVSTQWH